jgi:hypothetical protein
MYMSVYCVFVLAGQDGKVYRDDVRQLGERFRFLGIRNEPELKDRSDGG